MQKLWLVVLIAIIAGLIFVLSQGGESSNDAPAMQSSQPAVSTDQTVSADQGISTDQGASVNQLVGTWRDAKSGEERRFDSDGTMWIKYPHRVSDASPESSRAFDFSGYFNESGTYRILTDGRIEISMKWDPANKSVASLDKGHLILRGPDGTHVYDVASESRESQVLRDLNRGNDSNLYPGGF